MRMDFVLGILNCVGVRMVRLFATTHSVKAKHFLTLSFFISEGMLHALNAFSSVIQLRSLTKEPGIDCNECANVTSVNAG